MKHFRLGAAALLAMGLFVACEQVEKLIPEREQLETSYYPGAAVMAAILVAIHLSAPRLRRMLEGYTPIVGSFGGGMSAAYVFLHLIPELSRGHELLGEMIFAVPLAGFVAHYVVHRGVEQEAGSDPRKAARTFITRLINLCFYNLLVVYGVSAAGLQLEWRTYAILIALALHLLHADFSFGEDYPRKFDAVARYWLAASSFAAWLIMFIRQRTNEVMNDLFVVFLAGSVLFVVFRDEVPDRDKSRIRWFIAGIAAFAASVAISGA